MTTLTELLAIWDSPEGHPYKGELINWGAYEADPTNLGCMCAQGQVLHLLGGKTFEDLQNMLQSRADEEVAKLLNISLAHSIFLRLINDSADGAPASVLAAPEKLLGPRGSQILDLWAVMPRASAWAVMPRASAWAGAWAGAGAEEEVGAGAWAGAGAGATLELRNIPNPDPTKSRFHYLNLCGFATPEDIPPRPANYGVPANAQD